MSKKVKRFLLVGRVVRKKLTRATQDRLETAMESRQRSNFTASAIFPEVFDPIIHSKNETNCGFALLPKKKLRKKHINLDGINLRINNFDMLLS